MAAIDSLVDPRAQGEQSVLPDINMMLEKFLAFAEIWSPVSPPSMSGQGLCIALTGRFRFEIRVSSFLSILKADWTQLRTW